MIPTLVLRRLWGTFRRLDHKGWFARRLRAFTSLGSVVCGYPRYYTIAEGEQLDVSVALDARTGASFTPANNPARSKSIGLAGYEVLRGVDDQRVSGGKIEDVLVAGATVLERESCAHFCGSGCDYTTKLSLDSSGFKPGSYRLRLQRDDGGTVEDIWFVVRPNQLPDPRYRVVVIHPTFTLQAYNTRGGESFYHPPRDRTQSRRLRKVSLLRAFDCAMGGHHSPSASVAFEKMLERLDVPYFSIDSLELDLNPHVLDGIRLVLLTGHDEYITQNMRDRLDKHVLDGGRIAVFSGNAADSRVARNEFEISAVKSGSDPQGHTGKFASRSIGNPIDSSLALAYRFGGVPIDVELSKNDVIEQGFTEHDYNSRRAMTVLDAEHPIFAGTGLENGDSFGHDENLVDIELDGLPMDENDALGAGMAPCPPSGTQFLASALLHRRYRRAMRVWRVATIAQAKRGDKGGIVVHLGSIGWWRVAGGDSTAGRIASNTILYLLR